MASSGLAPAILQYIDNGAYPESDLASNELSPESLSSILLTLRQEQDAVKNEIRSLSGSAAPDIDTWISRAKDLQHDILRSRDTARQIVAEAEKGMELKAKAEEARRKAGLLEREVGFSESLVGKLERVRDVARVLDGAKEAAVKGNVEQALKRLETVEDVMAGLEGMYDTRVFGLLQARIEEVKKGLVGTVGQHWGELVEVDLDGHSLTVRAHLDDKPTVAMESVLASAEQLGLLDRYLKKLSANIDRAILRPLLIKDATGKSGSIVKDLANTDALVCKPASRINDSTSILESLETTLDFLHSHLPTPVGIPLSTIFMPTVVSRLEEHWLEPSVPLDMARVSEFEITLTELLKFADHVDSLQWYGADQVRQWVDGAPRAWLTKRRETLLGDVRNLVFSGLQARKIVERVETEMVGKDYAFATSSNGGEDDWDSAWEEPSDESHASTAAATSAPADTSHAAIDDDDEASAWDTDELETHSDKTGETGEEAWGWGDNDEANKTPSPVVTRRNPAQSHGAQLSAQPVQREVTLREAYTSTAVPASLLKLIQVVISDAQTLFGPEYVDSPIAPAAQGLYTLPTLALAIYRATAPTAYAKLPVGNMLIYNDATCLSASLLAWQASEPPESRLRLEGDTTALDTFAKRAYTAELDAQRTVLRDLLDGAQSFVDCTVQPNKAECEDAVHQVTDRLREVHALWKPILSPSALLQSLGSLLASVVSKIILEIEELGDIAEADSKQLKSLCDTVSSLKSLFVTASPGSDIEGATDMTFIYCPPWLKFQYLAEILESSLADIRYLWNEGELSLEFEREEVVELVEALFSESELRRRAVGEIRRGR